MRHEGEAEMFDEAVRDLAQRAFSHFPRSTFAMWWPTPARLITSRPIPGWPILRDNNAAPPRAEAAIEACRGIPTETLIRIAALPVTERPAALTGAPAKQAKKIRA